MDDEPVLVAERGLLAVSDDVWNLAVRRAAVIGPLASAGVARLAAGVRRAGSGYCVAVSSSPQVTKGPVQSGSGYRPDRVGGTR